MPAGTQLVITPAAPLAADRRYLLVVRSDETGGLRDALGRPIEPDPLFELLNTESEPVSAAGTITSQALLEHVEQRLLAAAFPGLREDELDAGRSTTFYALVVAAGPRLREIYELLASAIADAVALGVERDAIALANAWSTARGPTHFDLELGDWLRQPFPSVELATVADSVVPGARRVALPELPGETPSFTALREELNQLDGFSVSAPITLTASRDLDAASIDPTPLTPCTADDCRVVMVPFDPETGQSTGAAVELEIEVATASQLGRATLTLQPVTPLLPRTDYAIGLRAGILDTDGRELVPEPFFELLKIDGPLADATAVADQPAGGPGGTLQEALQCLAAPAPGTIAEGEAALQLALSIESEYRHPEWRRAFEALENAGIARDELLMAFTYRTRSITDRLDEVRATHLERDAAACAPSDPCWEAQAGGARVVDTGVNVVGEAALVQLTGVIPTMCISLCEAGLMVPSIPPNACKVHPNLPDHQVCRTAQTLVSDRLGSARLFVVRTYVATRGNPYATAPDPRGTIDAASLAAPQPKLIPMWVLTGSGTPAPGGIPVAIFQHDLFASKEQGFYIANALAEPAGADGAGWATVLIDLPFHGQRASDLVDGTGAPCSDVDPGTVTCVDPDGPGPAPTSCVNQSGVTPCDGVPDPSGTGFVTANLSATRDNMLQAAIDQLAVIRAIRTEAQPGGVLDFLDPDRIALVGHGFGGLVAAQVAAHAREGELEAVALRSAGGGLGRHILLESVGAIADPVRESLIAAGLCTVDPPAESCTDTAEMRRARTLVQWLFDAVDPLASAPGVTSTLADGRTPLGAHRILMQRLSANPVLPPNATLALARAYGFDDDAARLQTYDFTGIAHATTGNGCHGLLLDPACGACAEDALCRFIGWQRQAATFVASGAMTVAPRVQDVSSIDCDAPCP